MTLSTNSVAIGTGNTTILTAPAGQEVMVPLILLNNTSTTQDTVSISYYSLAANATALMGEWKVSRYSPVQALTKPVTMAPGDSLIMSSLNGTCRVTLGADLASVALAVGFNLRGNWTSGANYGSSTLDTVQYNGSSYVCATSHTAGGGFDATKWVVLASVGAGANSKRYALGGCQGDNIVYGYDGSGRISTIADFIEGNARSTTYTYDTSGRLTQVVRVWQGVTHTDVFAYDPTSGSLTGTTTTEA